MGSGLGGPTYVLDEPFEWGTSQRVLAGTAVAYQLPATVLNALLLVLMRRDPVLCAQRTIVLLWNVALCDLCTALSLVPLHLFNLSRGGWYGGFAACAWGGVTSLFWCQVSVLALALI